VGRAGAKGYVIKHLQKFGDPWIVAVAGKDGKPAAISGIPVKNPQDVEVYRTSNDANRRLIAVREEYKDVPALWLRDNGKWVQIPGLPARHFDLSPDGKMFVFAGKPSEKAPEGVFLYSIDDKQGKPLATAD
jgi:hypothetical protein